MKMNPIPAKSGHSVQDRLELTEREYGTLRCAQLCACVAAALSVHYEDGVWRSRALALFTGVAQVLCYLRDRGYIRLDARTLKDGLTYAVLQKLIRERMFDAGGQFVRIDDAWFPDVAEPLKQFLQALPGYTEGAQPLDATLQHYGYLSAMLAQVVAPTLKSNRSAYQ
ncbi:hypothetical protein [Ralstonia sp. ASV6]|uniref:hypothetical protein n=1 Tax=Ralstonia sp. ASV6 TaxID=2795124 RepID=UPI0018EE39BC|nr:hypothetical protein [Ralstonia sp. ASV6]